MRNLRIRLTASYVLIFALVLITTGVLFRQALIVILHQQNERVLMEEWGALKGYLHLRQGEFVWAYDPADPEESFAVERLRRVLMLASKDGEILELSNGYGALGAESQDTIRKAFQTQQAVTVTRYDSRGNAYLVRIGVYHDQGAELFLALGLAAQDLQRLPNRVVGVYFLMLPVILLALGVLGWFASGRALQPLRHLAAVTRSVSEGNLSLRIQRPGSDDEVDTLIGTFNTMMERLEHNFQQIRQFSIDASHELRTPITVIRGQLEVALLTAETREHYREAIVAALHDVERLGQIVKSLLLLAQAESGQLKLEKTWVDLAPRVLEDVHQFRLAAGEKDIQIHVDLPEECEAEVDLVQFQRLLSNLLTNAIKFTQVGGEVRVVLAREPGEVRLTVADNGPGIGEHHLPKIFDHFYQVRQGDRASDKGIGLGLAFVAWIVKAHGGEVSVESQEGQGATFNVRLPVGRPGVQPTASNRREHSPAQSTD
jgi:heavy metal sensor kinase